MSQAQQLVDGLGGATNIDHLESCITRLQAVVVNDELVDETALINCGARGLVCVDDTVHIIVGPNADAVANDMRVLL